MIRDLIERTDSAYQDATINDVWAGVSPEIKDRILNTYDVTKMNDVQIKELIDTLSQEKIYKVKESSDEERDEIWDYLIEYGIATEDELQLVTNIIGFTKEALEKVIYAKTGYRSLAQLKDEDEDDANESKVNERDFDLDAGKYNFEVTYRDEYKADSEEEAYDKLLSYLQEVVENQDVTAFTFVNLTKFREKYPKKEG